MEFTNEKLRVAAMACLTLSVVLRHRDACAHSAHSRGAAFGSAEARFSLFGQRSSPLLPQYLLLLVGVIL